MKPLIMKWLAVGIILLFVGVSTAPTINFNTVKASQEDDLMEVTTQACGIQGYGDTTVKLTREQYAEIQKLFDEVQTQLDATNSLEEALPIYYNAIVELNKYGLLPQGMNVETAQNLVTGGYKHAFQPKSFQEPTDNLTNAFCFIVGNFTDWDWMVFYCPLTLILLAITSPILLFLFIQLVNGNYSNGLTFLFLAAILSVVIYFPTNVPVKFMSRIILGTDFELDVVTGKINTSGILGQSSIEGDMKGIIGGFTGLSIQSDIDNSFMLLGFSLYAHIYNC